MSNYIAQLNNEEQALVLNAPLMVAVLIAGADGEISSEEKDRTLELVSIKTFSEKFGLKEIYAEINKDTAKTWREIIAGLPKETNERNEVIVSTLRGLNDIFPQLDFSFAHRLYKSLTEFAHFIAKADGGFWSMGAIAAREAEFIKLPFLIEPKEVI